MPAHHRTRKTKPLGDTCCRAWPSIVQRTRNALGAGAREFHSTSVSEIKDSATPGVFYTQIVATSPAVVEMTGVNVRFGSTQVLHGLSLTLAEGRITALLGPNGAGKSTAMGVISGLVHPQSGHVHVLHHPPGSLAARLRTGVMLQEGGIPSQAHGPDIVRHIAVLRGVPEAAEPLVEALDISRLRTTTFRRMSGGEKKRVALACALVGTPSLILVDEPTAGLDPPGRRMVWEHLHERRQAGATIGLCTHDMAEAATLADDIAIIKDGRCRGLAPLGELVGSGEESIIFSAALHLDITGLRNALPEGCLVVESHPGQYRITGPVGPQSLATVSAWCGQLGVRPRDLRVSHRDLEDVYWEMTGSHWEIGQDGL